MSGSTVEQSTLFSAATPATENVTDATPPADETASTATDVAGAPARRWSGPELDEHGAALRNQFDTALDALVAIEAERSALEARHHRALAAAADAGEAFAAASPFACDRSETEDATAHEIATALAWSRASVSRRMATARRLITELPAVLEALAGGRLDAVKAWTLLHATEGYDPDIAAAAVAAVLSYAGEDTPGELRARLRRVLTRLERHPAERVAKAKADRGVWIEPEANDMATLRGLLAAGDATAICHRLDRTARSFGRDDPRGMDQRRADTLVDLLLGRLPLPMPAPTDTSAPDDDSDPSEWDAADRTDVHPDQRASTDEGDDTATTRPAGAADTDGAVDTDQPGDTRHAATDEAGEAGGIAVTRPAGAADTGKSADTDQAGDTRHCAGVAGAAAAAETDPVDVTALVVLDDLLEEWPDPGDLSVPYDDGEPSGEPVPIPLGTYPLVTIYLPADPDTPDAPEAIGELAGYGPVTGATAAAIAADIITGRLPGRILRVDELLASVADIGTRVYPGHDPPARLAELVRARDGTCRFPGCRQPAHRCDLDHTIAWGQPGGHTSYTNLGALCRTHHRAKSNPGRTGWRVEHRADHTYTWTSPLDRTYTTTPDGPLARL